MLAVATLLQSSCDGVMRSASGNRQRLGWSGVAGARVRGTGVGGASVEAREELASRIGVNWAWPRLKQVEGDCSIDGVGDNSKC